jgi:hemoglobin
MTAGATLYERMGGADALRKLVDDFYDLIENDPDGEILNLLHLRGHGVAHSRIEQFNFLSGFFGGPRLYTEKHGHSDVREMHRHVEVGPTERDAWLLCMQRAVDGMAFEREVSERLMKHFRVVANVLEIENRKNEKTRAAAG